MLFDTIQEGVTLFQALQKPVDGSSAILFSYFSNIVTIQNRFHVHRRTKTVLFKIESFLFSQMLHS